MNRISTASLTISTVAGLFCLATACGSGGDDPNKTEGGGASNTGATGNNAGNTAGGGSSTTGGNPGTAGNTPTAGTLGTAGSAATVPSVCDGQTRTLPLAEAYVDNFETVTRFKGWYNFSDTDPPGKPVIAREAEGALGTAQSAHVSAVGIAATGFGAGFGFNLVNPELEKCIDLSAFDGVSFWAKGSAGADNALKFQAVVPATQPTDVMPFGDCAVVAKCYLHPAKTITLTETWEQHVIAFADLKAAEATWTGKILGFNMITPGPDYEAWIDEVTFYKGTAPTTAVTPAEAGAGGAGGAGG